VLAAAVHSGSPIIVTFNLRHFRSRHLEPWDVRALHPESFLCEIFRREQTVVMMKLEQQATDRRRSLRQLLDVLNAAISWRPFRLSSQENKADSARNCGLLLAGRPVFTDSALPGKIRVLPLGAPSLKPGCSPRMTTLSRRGSKPQGRFMAEWPALPCHGTDPRSTVRVRS